MRRRLYELVAEGCQFVIATHSPILLSFPQSRIYELSENGIATVPYDATETVELYRALLASPEEFLHHLSRDDDL
jgi:predicted ATPase